MTSSPPKLSFGLVELGGGNGLPVERNEGYSMLLDAAVAGGKGTAVYLDHMLKFADLAAYLSKAGESAFTQTEGPDANTRQASATNREATMEVGVRLNDGLQPQSPGGTPVVGLATVRLSLPAPYEVVKIVQFGVTLADIPAGIVVTKALWQALFDPLLQRLTGFVRTAVEDWLRIDVGGDAEALGEAIGGTVEDAATSTAEEAAEVVVEEEVVAELAIDVSVAVPAFAALGVLVAVPLLISALAKSFELHLEVDNLTEHDIEWAVEYQYDGAMTAQPTATTIPRVGKVTDAWGDRSTVDVAYQANFSSMNKSGFEGTGFALRLSPAGVTGQDLAAVVSVPWIADNAVWLGDGSSVGDWQSLFDDHSSSDGRLRASYGNQRLYATLAIDALSGRGDRYHAVLRIQPL